MKHGTNKVQQKLCKYCGHVRYCLSEGIDIVCLPNKTHWAPMPHREKKEWKQLWLDF
jgi:hypothetical protein